jgi:hypothetical protein
MIPGSPLLCCVNAQKSPVHGLMTSVGSCTWTFLPPTLKPDQLPNVRE